MGSVENFKNMGNELMLAVSHQRGLFYAVLIVYTDVIFQMTFQSKNNWKFPTGMCPKSLYY